MNTELVVTDDNKYLRDIVKYWYQYDVEVFPVTGRLRQTIVCTRRI